MMLFSSKDMIVCDLKKTSEEHKGQELDTFEIEKTHPHKGLKIKSLLLIDDRHLYVMSEGLFNDFEIDTSSFTQ